MAIPDATTKMPTDKVRKYIQTLREKRVSIQQQLLEVRKQYPFDNQHDQLPCQQWEIL